MVAVKDIGLQAFVLFIMSAFSVKDASRDYYYYYYKMYFHSYIHYIFFSIH